MLQLLALENKISSERFNNHFKRTPKILQAATSAEIISQLFLKSGLVEMNEENLVSTDVLQSTLDIVREACLTRRDEWRKLLIDHVCEYVEVPAEHPLRSSLHKIDRLHFMPKGKEYFADYDFPIPIKEGMTESAIHAVLMSIMPMNIKPGDHVLIAGAKGGFLGALIQDLVGTKGKVTLLDWNPEIVSHAQSAFSAVSSLSKQPEVKLKEDITEGYAEGAPWNAIILNGTVPKIPYDLIHQLDDDDGRILFFLAEGGGSSQCLLIHKNKSIIQEEKLSKFRYTNIPGKYGFDELSKLQKQYQASVDNMTNELVNRIQKLVHYPVSRSFMSAYNARDPHERHMRILKVGECLVKYLAVIALSEVHANTVLSASEPGTIRFSETVHKLAGRPANGNWLSSLRDSLAIGAALPLSRMISEDWEKPWKNADLIAAQEMLVRETTREKSSGLRQVRLKDLLAKLIEYRNKTGEGHGNVASMSQAESNAGILIRAFSQLLPELNIFKQADLLCVHTTERKGDKDQVVASQLSGSHFINQRYAVGEDHVSEWYKLSGHVVLTDRMHQTVLADIHPWIIWTDMGSNKENELYLFNSFQSGNYDYITYHNPSVYPDPNLKGAFSKVLSKYPEPTVAKVQATQSNEVFQGIIRGLLGVFLADMRIQSYEMAALVQETIKHGVAEDEAQAEKWIRDLIDRDYPGVYYGEE